MRVGFENLNESEYGELKKSIALITVLIAGADGHIDNKEVSWAKKVAEIRSFNIPKSLNGFYQDVGEDFSEVLDCAISSYPNDKDERQAQLSLDLCGLNDILSKLDPAFGASVYHSLTSFAKHVAKASGGFLGFFSVDSEEKKWIELPMIDPVKADDSEDII